VVFSPNGNYIASGSLDNTVKVWDTQNGKLIQTLKGHTDIVCSVVFSPDGNYIMSVSLDDILKVWQITEFNPLRKRG